MSYLAASRGRGRRLLSALHESKPYFFYSTETKDSNRANQKHVQKTLKEQAKPKRISDAQNLAAFNE